MEIALTNLNILALDCQTTGANPDKGHLLEIGWIPTHASAIKYPSNLQAETYLVNLPTETQIPRSIKRITGISEKDLSEAISSKQVWQKLTKAAQAVATTNRLSICPAVIHFARFEESFLRDLHEKNHSRSLFPFQFICTHEITKRLLPGLPRRGLRAIAGYFNHAVPEFRRSAQHTVATAVIWKNVVQLLRNDYRITTLAQLQQWLTSKTPVSRSTRFYPMDPKARHRLPDGPGIYRMLRANGDLLYIGKAKSLKQRINSYFRQTGSHAEHIMEMLTQAISLDFTSTGSALEAAILESDEIKRHSPPYNVALRKHRRELVFCSKDLKQASNKADQFHPIGPLPSGNLIEAMAAFGNLMDGRMSNQRMNGFSDLANRLLNLPKEYAPDSDCMREGFNIFHQKHRAIFHQNSPLRALTGLGAQLWRKQLELLELGNDTDQEDNPRSEATKAHEWTPEDVANTIEHVMTRAAHLIRRVRWFCLLSESSLAWESRRVDDNHKILIIFKDGAMDLRKTLRTKEKPPWPAGFSKPFQDRKKYIDLMTYDRLRVVTTELRRLVSEGRTIELCLGPKTILRREELEKALRWV